MTYHLSCCHLFNLTISVGVSSSLHSVFPNIRFSVVTMIFGTDFTPSANLVNSIAFIIHQLVFLVYHLYETVHRLIFNHWFLTSLHLSQIWILYLPHFSERLITIHPILQHKRIFFPESFGCSLLAVKHCTKILVRNLTRTVLKFYGSHSTVICLWYITFPHYSFLSDYNASIWMIMFILVTIPWTSLSSMFTGRFTCIPHTFNSTVLVFLHSTSFPSTAFYAAFSTSAVHQLLSNQGSFAIHIYKGSFLPPF